MGSDHPLGDESVSLATLARRSVSVHSGVGAVTIDHTICNSNKKDKNTDVNHFSRSIQGFLLIC